MSNFEIVNYLIGLNKKGVKVFLTAEGMKKIEELMKQGFVYQVNEDQTYAV